MSRKLTNHTHAKQKSEINRYSNEDRLLIFTYPYRATAGIRSTWDVLKNKMTPSSRGRRETNGLARLLLR